jgi:hypothetical protein
MKTKIQHIIQRLPLELVFWTVSLILIWSMEPAAENHFTMCPLDRLGFTWCPGCGLGRAMNLMMHGEFLASFSMHPLAVFAIAVILLRIFRLIKNLKTYNYYG